MTLLTLLMTMTSVMVFSILAFVVIHHLNHNETLRNFDLASQSILNTYDRYLFEGYSLLATDLDRVQPELYLDEKLSSLEWSFEPTQTLSDPEGFMRSIKTAMTIGLVDDVLKAEPVHFSEEAQNKDPIQFSVFESALKRFELFHSEKIRVAGASSQIQTEISLADLTSPEPVSEEVTETVAPETIELAKRAVKVLNPSEDIEPEKADFETTIEDALLEQMPSRTHPSDRNHLSPQDSVWLMLYANRHFKNRIEDKRDSVYSDQSPKTYFEACETEYLLYGYASETLNAARAYAEIYLLRLAGNVVHVAACEQKRGVIEQLSAAVAAVFFVPPPVTSTALTVAWGALESRSDMKRLLNGASLPWVHSTDQEWKTDLLGAEVNPDVPELPQTSQGRLSKGLVANYQDHLNFLLFGKADTRHILRSMDLIILNQTLTGKPPLVFEKRSIQHRLSLAPSTGRMGIVWEDGYGLD
jgi:hypothetical protein